MNPPESLQTAQKTLSVEDTQCVHCGKDFVVSNQLFTLELEDGLKEVTLDCPHCKFSVHVFYTNRTFELRANRLKFLFTRYQKNQKNNYLMEARLAQKTYQKDFERFNQQMVNKRRPMTQERYQREFAKLSCFHDTYYI